MTRAAEKSLLLAELLDAIRDGYLVPCDSEDQLLTVLAAVDFDVPMTMHRARRTVTRWRTGGDA